MNASLTIAVVQCALNDRIEQNVSRVCKLVEQAARQGAQIILTPELFETPYFPQHLNENAFDLAKPLQGHPTIAKMQSLARQYQVVLPVSFFELQGQAYYNSVAVVDADANVLGIYHKSHLPDGPGYHEKFYFSPGNTGFRVWETLCGRIGVGVCWDQWFPESARAMALSGAEVLLYPSALGSEPAEPHIDTHNPWRRVMLGHAVANAMPIASANRIGDEKQITFYGSSFIADHCGEIISELGRDEEGIALATFDRNELRRYRANWGFFRDRRPDLYGILGKPNNE